MDRLFCPWRYSYVTSAPAPESECVLCDLGAGDPSRDREGLIVHRAHHHYVVLNKYPYTSGHVMIVPYAHLERLSELPPEALPELSYLMARAESVLSAEYRAEGLNVGLNLGRYAGAGIPRHLHTHVVPRWSGDTHFMTVTGETRVIPEELDDTWQRLRRCFGENPGTETPRP
jgi:ATP adenylyltransferase